MKIFSFCLLLLTQKRAAASHFVPVEKYILTNKDVFSETLM